VIFLISLFFIDYSIFNNLIKFLFKNLDISLNLKTNNKVLRF
jgi:hypothetical protein